MTLAFARPLRMAALLAAFGLLGGPVDGAQSDANAQTPTMNGYPAVGAPPVVTVLRPGAAPRTQLRYVVPATQKTQIQIVTKVSRAVSGPGVNLSDESPTIKVTAGLAVAGVAQNGDISYDIAFASMELEAGAGADPSSLKFLQGLVALATSVKGSATVSNRGVTTSTRLEFGHPAAR